MLTISSRIRRNDFCQRIVEPCVACVPYDRKLETSRDMDRWNDCFFHKVGEACRTESCSVGVCTECSGEDCRLDTVCVEVAPPSHRGPLYLIAAGGLGAVGLFAWVLVLRRRSRR